MSTVMDLTIVSAEENLYSGQVQMISVTGGLGELGIYPGHTPLLTTMKPGQIKARLDDGEEKIFYISGGMLEVQPKQVIVMADTAQRAEDLDEAVAQMAKERAEKAIEDNKSELEYSKALAELAQAAAQLRAIKSLRKKGRS